MSLKKTSLRANQWDDFIGQDQVVKSLKITIQAAKQRGESLEHILFYGPPGLGKTTLAHLVSSSLGVNLKPTSGPSLTRVGDLAAILTQLQEGDILFIDEIHRLSKPVEETLYPAMEDFCLDMMVGKGPGAHSLRLDLPHFTLIGATTKAGMISAPLRDRFGLTHRLKYYEDDDLAKVIIKAAHKLNSNLDLSSAYEIARRSRGTPRLALKLLKRVLDFAQVEYQKELTPEITRQSLEFYQVDNSGLDETDRRLLIAIIKDHKGGPVGLETLAALISEDIETITDIYEPFLLQSGFLSRTSRGRVATPKAYSHLKITPNN